MFNYVDKRVKIDQVKPNSYNPNIQNPFIYAKLIESFEKHGQLSPIMTWRPENSKKYIIINGEHSYKALLELGYEKIHIRVLEGITSAEAKTITMSMNIHGEDEPEKLAELFNSLITEDGWDVSKLIEEMPLSKEYIKETLSLLEQNQQDLDEMEEMLETKTKKKKIIEDKEEYDLIEQEVSEKNSTYKFKFELNNQQFQKYNDALTKYEIENNISDIKHLEFILYLCNYYENDKKVGKKRN